MCLEVLLIREHILFLLGGAQRECQCHLIQTAKVIAVAPDLDSKLIRVHLCWVGLVGHKGRFRRHFVRVTAAHPPPVHHRPKTGSSLMPDPAHVLLCTPTNLLTLTSLSTNVIHPPACLSSTLSSRATLCSIIHPPTQSTLPSFIHQPHPQPS